jgi:hypothetical protein
MQLLSVSGLNEILLYYFPRTHKIAKEGLNRGSAQL